MRQNDCFVVVIGLLMIAALIIGALSVLGALLNEDAVTKTYDAAFAAAMFALAGSLAAAVCAIELGQQTTYARETRDLLLQVTRRSRQQQ